MKTLVFVAWFAVVLLALPAARAQEPPDPFDPLRFVSGTAANPGAATPWLASEGDAWTWFHGFSAHVAYVSETGPEEQRNEVFSTNWLALGALRTFDRGFLLVRGRVSLEPYTVGEEGYPQMLQYIPGAQGEPVDRMRPSDLFGEAAMHAGFRAGGVLLHVYAAPVGDPALGAPPHALRASSIDFAEAPFAWDLQEAYHGATSVVTAGLASRWVAIEGSVFHAAEATEGYTGIDDGDLDSRSVRLVLTPGTNVSMQVSRGELGEDLAQRTLSSASVSWRGGPAAATALWTRREHADGRPAETAYGFELVLRAGRNGLMGRAEWVDRPEGFPESLVPSALERTTHFTAGYLYDFVLREQLRAGMGLNIDYHTQSHDLEHRYGHKPQSIYAFVRVRTR